jgi:hypothetical protein
MKKARPCGLAPSKGGRRFVSIILAGGSGVQKIFLHRECCTECAAKCSQSDQLGKD